MLALAVDIILARALWTGIIAENKGVNIDTKSGCAASLGRFYNTTYAYWQTTTFLTESSPFDQILVVGPIRFEKKKVAEKDVGHCHAFKKKK